MVKYMVLELLIYEQFSSERDMSYTFVHFEKVVSVRSSDYSEEIGLIEKILYSGNVSKFPS
jgi:hypothetical protein